MRGLALTIVILCGACNAAKFPNTWKKCRMDGKHNECLKEAIQGAIPDLVKGIPKLGVLPVDPLKFNRIAIEQNDRPVSLNLILTDVEIKGIRKANIDAARNDWKTMNVNVSAPVLKVNSKYKIDGKVLVLPIQGEGDCQLQLDAFKATITIKFEEKLVNGKAFYNVKNVDVLLDTQKLIMKFENLFNGNKQLGDQMNTFLNENWQDIFMELKPAVEAALRQACIDLATRFFVKVPKNEITPQ